MPSSAVSFPASIFLPSIKEFTNSYRAVRSHALAAILADFRGPQARRNFGCWYSQMDLSVRWNCEDAGGLSAARYQSAMLTIDLDRDVD